MPTRPLSVHVERCSNVATGPDEPRGMSNEVLTLLAKGCLYKEISNRLGIGVTTVRTHLKHIYEKLHVQSRTEAAVKFLGRE